MDKKAFLKNISVLFMATVGFFTETSHVLAEIPGKYFAADLDAIGLLGIVKSHPTLFTIIFFAFVLFFLGYGIYHLVKKPK